MVHNTVVTLGRAVLPWWVRKSLAAGLGFWKRRKPPFVGVFKQFGDAAGDGYARPQWVAVSVASVEAVRQHIGQKTPESLSYSKSLLPVLIGSMPGPLRIMDFGGACGVDYAWLLATGNRADISYHVVDTESVCAAGRRVWSGDSNIAFSPDIPDATFDVIYAYSALHCVADFRTVLKQFAALRPKAILLCKHPVRDGESYVRAQINMGKDLPLAQWVLGLDDITTTLAAAGYQLAFRAYGEDIYNVDNYDKRSGEGRVMNLLFVPHAPVSLAMSQISQGIS